MNTKEKEFFLHSKTIADGRDSIQKMITAYLPSAPQHFPPATPGLLDSAVSMVKYHASRWLQYADGGKSHIPMIFNEAVAASSWATVAKEIAVDFHWVSRLDYAPDESEKSCITTEMRTFARDFNRLLNVIYDLARALRDSTNGDVEQDSADTLRFQRRQRLQQALYLSELGVQMTIPDHYGFHHPEASKWLSLRASVRRKMAEALLEAADAEETEATAFRGRVRY